ncbi:zincin-like metallopeptidase domain-containing protein [Dubosiella newyorkensis]|nr:zincin-like metallopeptidase domain-containing protein [Dubosiella newyorkensis]
MKILNDELKIYEIDYEYISFLQKADKRVSIKKHRPFVGVLVNMEGVHYCIPLTSQVVPKSGRLRNELITTIIEDKSGHQIAAVLYNNMIPVSLDRVRKWKPKNRMEQDYLRNEIRFLTRNKQEVLDKASFVLENSSRYPFMRKICVNYKRLKERLFLFNEIQKEKGKNEMEKKKAPKSVKERLVEAYIKCLEKGTIPWYRGWSVTAPIHNMSSGRAYTGYNRLILQLESAEAGYKDPRWLTFNQMKQMGFSMDKGNKGVRLERKYLFDKKAKEPISLDEYNIRKNSPDFDSAQYQWRSRPFYVFNAEQINGVPPLDKKLIPIKGNEVIEQIPEKMGVTLTYGGDKAYYNPIRDSVRLPEKGQFKDEYVYASTLLHELCHATGHKSRLNRDMTGTFGSEEYAKEELRAEIGSSFLMAALQIEPSQQHMDRHKAYVQDWVAVLKKDPEELDKAIKGAEKIEEYVRKVGGIDKALEQAKKQEITQEKKLPMKEKDKGISL